MLALIAELAPIGHFKASTASLTALLARLHHNVRWDRRFGDLIDVVLKLHLPQKELVRRIIRSSVGAMEALREAKAKVDADDCLEILIAGIALTCTEAVCAAWRAWLTHAFAIVVVAICALLILILLQSLGEIVMVGQEAILGVAS